MSESTLPAGRIKRLYVNNHVIRANKSSGEMEPPLSIGTSDGVDRAHEVVIFGQDGLEAARLVYRPDRPLSCGARVFVETTGQVGVIVHDGPPA